MRDWESGSAKEDKKKKALSNISLWDGERENAKASHYCWKNNDFLFFLSLSLSLTHTHSHFHGSSCQIILHWKLEHITCFSEGITQSEAYVPLLLAYLLICMDYWLSSETHKQTNGDIFILFKDPYVLSVNVHLGSISPTFYDHLLRAQISKVEKDSDNFTNFFCTFGICAHKSCLWTCWWNWCYKTTFYYKQSCLLSY